ncbi:phage tail protein, partial [Acinetobacter puyangensis]
TIQSAMADGDNALGQRIDTVNAQVGENQAAIQEERTARASGDSALSQSINTVQTTVGQNTASIQEVTQSVNGIYTQKFIKFDVNGKLAGWGGANDGIESQFIFNFDSIAIGSGNSTGYYPFNFRTTSYTDPATGLVFPVGAYLSATFIDYASINTAHIADAAIKSAKIDDAAITNAKIANAAVNTLKIEDNAVTVPVAAYTAASATVGSDYVTVQSLVIPAGMGHTIINFGAVFSFADFAAKQQVLCRVVKGSEVIFDDLEVHYIEHQSQGKTTSNSGSHQHSVGVTVSGNTGTAGSHTHSFSSSGNTGSTNAGGTFHSHSFSASGTTGSSGDHNHSIALSGSGSTDILGQHSHDITVVGATRSAGTLNLTRHDSSGVNGTYTLQLKAASGGNISVSQRYIHAMTIRK